MLNPTEPFPRNDWLETPGSRHPLELYGVKKLDGIFQKIVDSHANIARAELVDRDAECVRHADVWRALNVIYVISQRSHAGLGAGCGAVFGADRRTPYATREIALAVTTSLNSDCGSKSRSSGMSSARRSRR